MGNKAALASVEPENFCGSAIRLAVSAMKRGEKDQHFLQEVLMGLGVDWDQQNGKAIESAVRRLKRDTTAHESVGDLLEAIHEYHHSSADGVLSKLFDAVRQAAEHCNEAPE